MHTLAKSSNKTIIKRIIMKIEECYTKRIIKNWELKLRNSLN